MSDVEEPQFEGRVSIIFVETVLPFTKNIVSFSAVMLD